MAENKPKKETAIGEPEPDSKTPKVKKPLFGKKGETASDKPEKKKPRRKKLDGKDFSDLQDRREKAPKEKKKAGAFTGFLCGFLIMLLLFVAAFGTVYFDIFGSKILLSGALGLSKTNEDARQAQQTELDRRSAEMQTSESKLDTRVAELDSRDKQITVREGELAAQKAELEKKTGEIEELRAQLKTQASEFEETVKLLSTMDVSNAAAIIMEMKDRDYVVRVLKAMKPKTTSEILAAIDPKDASNLLTLMAAGGGSD